MLHTEPVTEQNLSNVILKLGQLKTPVFVSSPRCHLRTFRKALAPVLLRWLEENRAAN